MEKDTKETKTKLLIGFSGSVATIKCKEMLNLFLKSGKYEIRVVFTERAKKFQNWEELKKFDDVQFFDDEMEWSSWRKRGDPVIHIDLRNWADIFLIAPLSANTLAKMACGLADNLLVYQYSHRHI